LLQSQLGFFTLAFIAAMSSGITLSQCLELMWIRHFANTAFGIVLGFGGQAMLWKFMTLWEVLEDGRAAIEGVQLFWWATCVATYIIFFILFTTKAALFPEVFRAEIKHPVRFNFFCGPIIGVCMLLIGMPPSFGDQTSLLQAMWCSAFFLQAGASLVIYHRWLVSSSVHDTAASPYLLSLISWFLLSAGGTPADIDTAAGFPLRGICFGIGAFFAVFTYPFILGGIYGGRTQAGTPASFLIIAPPSVAGISIIGINGGYHGSAGSLFGCVLFIFLLLVRMGPQILQPPRLLGVNWAYIFPQAAMSILSIKIAEHFQSPVMNTIAIMLSSIATLVIVIVAIRLAAHGLQVVKGKDVWKDPLVAAVNSKRVSRRGKSLANIEAVEDVEYCSEGEVGLSRNTSGASGDDSNASYNGQKETKGAEIKAAATATASAEAAHNRKEDLQYDIQAV